MPKPKRPRGKFRCDSGSLGHEVKRLTRRIRELTKRVTELEARIADEKRCRSQHRHRPRRRLI